MAVVSPVVAWGWRNIPLRLGITRSVQLLSHLRRADVGDQLLGQSGQHPGADLNVLETLRGYVDQFAACFLIEGRLHLGLEPLRAALSLLKER